MNLCRASVKYMSGPISAVGVTEARPADRRVGGGSRPTTALHDLRVAPIPVRVAKTLLVPHHYLHSIPGGTLLAFGVFVGAKLLGSLTLGAGPMNAHRLVAGAVREDAITLTRFWLDDKLPRNSESRVLGIVLRSLRRHTTLRFVLTYADPSANHVGTVYMAGGWLYVGLSEATPLYDLGDGVARHSRTVAHAYGTHSLKHFARHGVDVRVVPQASKHRYVYPLDPTVRQRLTVRVLPNPKREDPS